MKNFLKFKTKVVIFLGAFASILVGLMYAERGYETFPPVFNLTSLDGENGFVINGIGLRDYSGAGVSGDVDINGDGIRDALIVGAHQGYVLFGDKKPWPRIIELSSLNGKNGFVIDGLDGSYENSISGIGDVNGDGIADILIGVPRVNNYTGQSYVIFGSKGPWPPIININNLNGMNGFIINGIRQGEMCGKSVSGAGDINGDGIADMLIGAPGFDPRMGPGQSYVIFGSKESWPAKFYLANLDGNNGFIINGINIGDYCGMAVSGVGDINEDGIADILIDAPGFPGFGTDSIGQSYIIFGSKKPWFATFNPADLNGSNGFAINGIKGAGSSWALNGVGDVNGDGIADMILGASGAGKNGQSYVMFGSKGPWFAIFNLANLNGSNGFTINGISGVKGNIGSAVNGAGDINADGIADIILGASNAGNDNEGQSYVIFGSRQVWPSRFLLADLNGKNGFIINGISREDYSGDAVSGTGDVNGDGIDDIIIGAREAHDYAGQCYVIFGQR